jgi:hypothetical protein
MGVVAGVVPCRKIVFTFGFPKRRVSATLLTLFVKVWYLIPYKNSLFLLLPEQLGQLNLLNPKCICEVPDAL